MKTRHILGGAAAAAAALGLTSAVYQAVGEARDRRRHPPPGRLVDVGGYRLHIVCAGEGTPPVVICPALGATVDEWRQVQQQLAPVTAVCVYDRGGLGHSDAPHEHRTVKRMAEELHALLHAAGIIPPYVLAGHSIGGFVVRAFANRYPGEVAAVALVDSSHPEMRTRTPRDQLWQYPGGALLAAALEWTRPLGLRRLVSDLGIWKSTPGCARHRRADAGELLALNVMGGEVTGHLGNLPLAVITSAELDPNFKPGSRSQRGRSKFYPSWTVLQNELAALSSNSTHVVADHGGHHLNRDNPELVAKVLTDLVQRVRSAGRYSRGRGPDG